MTDEIIKIVPLNEDAPKEIQFMFGYRVWFMNRWRVIHSTLEHEIIQCLLRKIGAV